MVAGMVEGSGAALRSDYVWLMKFAVGGRLGKLGDNNVSSAPRQGKTRIALGSPKTKLGAKQKIRGERSIGAVQREVLLPSKLMSNSGELRVESGEWEYTEQSRQELSMVASYIVELELCGSQHFTLESDRSHCKLEFRKRSKYVFLLLSVGLCLVGVDSCSRKILSELLYVLS
jgi:hypothetical protein